MLQPIRVLRTDEPITPGPSPSLLDGAAVVNGVASDALFQTSGAERFTLRFKASVAGTLQLAIVREDGVTAYALPVIPSEAVVPDTELFLDLDLYGEPFVRARFTPSNDGTVTYCDGAVTR